MSQGSYQTQSRVQPGTRLNGIYEIDALIAAGGMGEVYKGHTIHTGDPVAIKLLRPEFAENDAALGLFRREASALNNIHHEAIVRYYVCSVDPDLQRPYLAMELVEGQSLSQVLQQGPLTFEAVQKLTQRLATGLQAAHERGIIHRDVAPDNVIISGGDVSRAKIIDFGIARSMQVGDGTIIGGGFAGKYNYVSPEQLGLFGGDVTPKSDIYSLGLVLVQALLGQPIDMSGSQVAVIEKRRKVPDLGAIDMRIRPLFEKMLQPDPLDRPASMIEVATWPIGAPAARRSAVSSAPARERPRVDDGQQGSGRGRWLAIAGSALVLLLAAGGGAYYYFDGLPGTTPGGLPAAPQLQTDGPSALNVPSAPALTPQAPSLTPSTPSIPSLPSPNALPSVVPPVLRPPAGLSRIDAITQFINSYDGGDCFYVTPVSVGETAARIEGLGSSVGPFQAMDDAFKRNNGFEPDIGVRQVTQQQCPAITFLTRTKGRGVAPPQLEVSGTSLQSGQTLSGTIDGYGTRHVELLLASDDGSVYNVTSLVKPSGDSKAFNLKMQLSGSKGAQPQILMAVTSPQPLAALQLKQPGDAAQVFPAALAEAASAGQTLGVAVRYFKLE